MKMISCKTMREGVIVSGAFLAVGVVMLFMASSSMLPDIPYLALIFNVVGIISLLFAPVLLTGTFITTVLPKSRDKLDNCDH